MEQLFALDALHPGRSGDQRTHGFHPAPVRDLGAIALAVLDRFAVAMLLLDGRGELLYFNSAAKKIIDARDGIGLAENRLAATIAKSRPALQKAITSSDGNAVEIPRPSGAPGYLVIATPNRCPGIEDETDLPDTRTVFILDPAGCTLDHEAAMRQLWGLTPAESRVASALLAGQTVNDIAASAGLSKSTVRIQMYSVFEKVGVRRQAELVRTLAALSGFCISRQ